MSGSPSATTHVEPLLADYHAGSLPPVDAAQVEAHLRGCAACRERSEQVAIDQIIRAAPTPMVGPELRQRLYARIAIVDDASDTATSRAALRDAHRVDDRPLAHPHGPRVSRGGWLSGVAAALLVALLVSVFWALPHLRQQPNHASKKVAPKVTTACPASATSATLPANAILNDMAFTSPTEGWAVGAIQDNQGNVTNGLIMRYSACHWAPVNISLPGVALMHISMDSPTDGWAAGNVESDWGVREVVLLHCANGVWSLVDASQRPANKGMVAALSMAAPDEGWLVTMGPDSSWNSSGTVAGYRPRLWHDAQGSWTNIAVPTQMVDAIASVGPNDLWVAGSDFTGAGKQTSHSFAHYHNGTWSETPQPAGLWANSLHANSPTDIWANGITTQGVPVVAHYDGVAWRDASDTLPAAIAGGKGVGVVLSAGEGWAYTLGTPNNKPVSPLGGVVFIASVLRETGGQWRSLSWPYRDIRTVSAWTPVADGEVWAVGTYWVTGTPTPLPGGGSTNTSVAHTFLVHYVDGAWSRYGSATP